jgi:hypothetical protein
MLRQEEEEEQARKEAEEEVSSYVYEVLRTAAFNYKRRLMHPFDLTSARRLRPLKSRPLATRLLTTGLIRSC